MEPPTTPIDLPVIDLSLLETESKTLASTLVTALQTYGFASLENVPGYDPSKLLSVAKDFFSQSAEEKLKITRRPYNPESPNCFRGFFPSTIGDQDITFRDGFDIGRELSPDDPDSKATFMYEHTPWPCVQDAENRFRKPVMDHFDAMDTCGLQLLKLIALGLGIEENVFDAHFERNPLTTVRLLHYPQRPSDYCPPEIARDGDLVLQCQDHRDSGFVTLLSTFHYAGLQVLVGDGDDAKWTDVIIKPDTLVMNIGEVLETLTGSRLKATRHRVVDYGVDRYSVVHHMEPRYDAEMKPLFGDGPGLVDVYGIYEDALKDFSPNSEQKYPRYGPWLMKKMQKIYVEFQDV